MAASGCSTDQSRGPSSGISLYFADFHKLCRAAAALAYRYAQIMNDLDTVILCCMYRKDALERLADLERGHNPVIGFAPN